MILPVNQSWFVVTESEAKIAASLGLDITDSAVLTGNVEYHVHCTPSELVVVRGLARENDAP